jgi:hypothetical protein
VLLAIDDAGVDADVDDDAAWLDELECAVDPVVAVWGGIEGVAVDGAVADEVDDECVVVDVDAAGAAGVVVAAVLVVVCVVDVLVVVGCAAEMPATSSAAAAAIASLIVIVVSLGDTFHAPPRITVTPKRVGSELTNWQIRDCWRAHGGVCSNRDGFDIAAET